MAKLSQDALSRVQAALRDYIAEVEASKLRPKAKGTYIRHAQTFVRWLDDDFEPGSRTG